MNRNNPPTRYLATVYLVIEREDKDFRPMSMKKASELSTKVATEATKGHLDVTNSYVQSVERIPEGDMSDE